MKANQALSALVCFLTACGGGKPSAKQCTEIFAQEIRFSMQQSLEKGGSVDDLLKAARYGDPHSCELGKTGYLAKDHACIVSAKDDAGIKACLQSAHRRMDASR